MTISEKKYLKLFSILVLLIIMGTLINVFVTKLNNNKAKFEEPIIINLLTSVHPNLPWKFKALNKKITVKPGEVTTIEYIVENLKDEETSGIATFAYFPKKFGTYIRKLNCFCYDAQTLKAKQKKKYSIVMLIDQEVTHDSKTKKIKEVTIQFTFFDYTEYKKNNG